MDICGIMTHAADIVGYGAPCECLRPVNHKGPHLICRANDSQDSGQHIAWQSDPCPPGRFCDGCDSDDPNDWCDVYWEVGCEEAQKLIEDPELTET